MAYREGRYEETVEQAEAGRRTAEARRAEAVDVFRGLAAVRLLERFEEEWSA